MLKRHPVKTNRLRLLRRPALRFGVSLATLLDFAQVCDAAAATSSKLRKQTVLAEYFRTLEEGDLKLAVRYAAGRAFAATDERVLNVGSAVVSEVALGMLKIDPRVYWDTVMKSGEIGEALAKLWPTGATGNALLLQELSVAFDALAHIGVAEIKRQLVAELFSRCINPREAAYLAKIIFGDMRTGVQEGILQAAVAEAFGATLGQVQRCQLLVGDLDAVAILAHQNRMCSASFQLFHPVQFMLATPQETPEIAAQTLRDRLFYAEDKLDGIRAQVHKAGERIAIYTRTMDRADACFPDVVTPLLKVPGDFLLDGEIVGWRDGRVLAFGHLQKRLGRKCPTARVQRDNPVVFVPFDILYLNGDLLMDRPLRERRAALEQLCAGEQPPVKCTSMMQVRDAAEIATIFEAARERGNEGIVLKDPESVYAPGRRGKAWLKLKTHLPTLDCVVTAAEFGHGKRRNTLSDYTFAVWDREPFDPEARLVNVGKAYSGVSDAEITQLTELFLKLSRQQHGHVHVVEPKVVFEIACDQIQKSNRHAGGYALRFRASNESAGTRTRWMQIA